MSDAAKGFSGAENDVAAFDNTRAGDQHKRGAVADRYIPDVNLQSRSSLVNVKDTEKCIDNQKNR